MRHCAPWTFGLCLIFVLMTGVAVAQPPTSFGVQGTYGPVKTETLLAVARILAPQYGDASVSQVAYALYRANPEAFGQGKIGGLRGGATLKIPDTVFIQSTPHPVARDYVLRQQGPPPAAPSSVATLVVAAGPPAAPAMPVSEPAPGRFKDSAEAQEMAGRLVTQRPEETYEQLLALEERHAGDVDFDYLLGTAALDSGRDSHAVFALQRAVASAPDYSGARLELARAYFGVGDNESARREFQTLQEEEPPPKVAETINRYLDAIDRRAVEYQRQQIAFVELSSGFDNNANGATDVTQFLGFTLDDRNRAQESPYYGVGAGAQFSYPLSPGLRAIAEAAGSHKAYSDVPFVDQTQARLALGAEVHAGGFNLGALASGAASQLDGEDNNRLLAADLSANHALGADWQAGLTVRFGQLRYTEVLASQDVDQLLSGLQFDGRFGLLPRVRFGFVLSAGRDDKASPGAVSYGRDILGARVSASTDLAAAWSGSALVAAQNSDYDRDFSPAFTRADRQTSGALGLDWRPGQLRGWAFRTQVTFVQNDSDQDLYTFDRYDLGLSVRKEFR